MRSENDKVAFVSVTRDMEEAGVECLRETPLDDIGYLVRSIYMAMEYQRLDSDGKLAPIVNNLP